MKKVSIQLNEDEYLKITFSKAAECIGPHKLGHLKSSIIKVAKKYGFEMVTTERTNKKHITL